MRVTTLPLMLMILTILSGLSGLAGPVQNPASIHKVDLGKEFRIRNGKVVITRGEGLRIRFKSVLSDSRCPTGAQCGWAGNAEVAIEIAGNNNKQIVTRLNTQLEPKEVAYNGFKIKLVALNPHPKVNVPINKRHYEATLIVTRDN